MSGGSTEAAILLGSTQGLAAFVILFLSAVVFLLKIQSRLHRALSALLLMQGMDVLMRVFAYVADAAESPTQDYWNVMDAHFLLALPFALLYFLLALQHRASPKVDALGRSLLVAAAILVQVLYATNHCLDTCTRTSFEVGPLALLSAGWPLAMAATAVFLLRTRTAGLASTGSRLMAVALACNAISHATIFVVRFVHAGEPLLSLERGYWDVVIRIMIPMAGPLGLAAIGLTALVRERGERVLYWPLLASALALGSSVWAGLSIQSGHGVGELVAGTWRLFLGCALAYGLLKHRIFGLELGLKKGVARGAVVGAFLIVFFVVKTIVELYLGHSYGYLWGGMAAGLALFALHPMEHLGNRFAELLVPGARPVHELNRDARARMYGDFAAVAWHDGRVDRRERKLLKDLQRSFGFTDEHAELLELRARVAVQKGTRSPK